MKKKGLTIEDTFPEDDEEVVSSNTGYSLALELSIVVTQLGICGVTMSRRKRMCIGITAK